MVSDHCLKFLGPYMLNYGGNLGHKTICGQTSIGTNIVRNTFLVVYYGKEALKYGNICLKIEMSLNNICGGNLGVELLPFGMIILPILCLYTYNK